MLPFSVSISIHLSHFFVLLSLLVVLKPQCNTCSCKYLLKGLEYYIFQMFDMMLHCVCVVVIKYKNSLPPVDFATLKQQIANIAYKSVKKTLRVTNKKSITTQAEMSNMLFFTKKGNAFYHYGQISTSSHQTERTPRKTLKLGQTWA